MNGLDYYISRTADARVRPVVPRPPSRVLVHGFPRDIEVGIREALHDGLGNQRPGVSADLERR